MYSFSISEKEIIKYLDIIDSDEYHTGADIADELNVSERTVRTRIKELKKIVSENGARIESRSHYGYRLKVENSMIFDSFLQRIRNQRRLADNMNVAVECILLLLLKQEYYTLDDLSERFFVSRSTLVNSIRPIESSLKEYNLAIERKQKYGIKICGSQFDIRLCAAHLIQKTSYYCTEEDLRKLAEIVKGVLQKYNILMADMAFNSFLAVLYVMMLELIYHHPYNVGSEKALKDTGYEIQYGAVDIKKALEDEYKIQIPDSEISFIAIHLGGKRYLSYPISTAWNHIIPNEIMAMVSDMLEVVKAVFNMDFTNNFDLQMKLSQHVIPLDIRIRFDMQTENPMLDVVKKNYAYAFNVAKQACVVIEKHSGGNMSEDETGYIAMMFALAMEQREQNIDKKNILLICAAGMSSCQLVQYKLRQKYGQYIDRIFVSNKYSLKNLDLKNIDYIFTTVPIVEKLDRPIVEVDQILESGGLPSFEQEMQSPSQAYLASFYAPDLFYGSIEGDTKEAVIHNLCERIAQTRILPDDFEKLVMKRERLSSTDFGNMIAMPHPIKRGIDTVIAVGVLEQPVFWGNHQVRMVFLVSIAVDIDGQQVQDFWRRTSEFMMDDASVKRVIACPEYRNFINAISLKEQE